MSESNLPDWEQLLSAAAHLQEILPNATLVGGTAVAIFTKHRLSRDADHVLPDRRHDHGRHQHEDDQAGVLRA